MPDIVPFSSIEYNSLLELTYEVVQALEGKVFDDGRIPDVELLAYKLYSHAASSYWLYQGTKSEMPRSTGGSFFVDNGSIIILARAALETYLTFYEVFIEPNSDDKFEFIYCLWHLSGKVFLENYKPIADTPKEKIESINSEIGELRNRIKKTQTFMNHTDKQKKQILKGTRIQNRLEIATSAGLGPYFTRMVYKFYSGFVHSDGYTSGKLFYAETINQQKEFAELHINIFMMVLSKFIIDFTDKFDETSNVLDRFPGSYQRALVWSEVASRFE